MSIYLNGKKYVGAYYQGQRINMYYHGFRVFTYSTTVTVNFYDTGGDFVDSGTVYNVPMRPCNLQLLMNDGLMLPYQYGLADPSSEWNTFGITPNDTINVSVVKLVTTVNIQYYDDNCNGVVGSQSIDNVPLGQCSFTDLQNDGASIPDHYDYNDNQGDSNSTYDDIYDISYNDSLVIHVLSEPAYENVYVMIPHIGPQGQRATALTNQMADPYGYAKSAVQTIKGYYGQVIPYQDVSVVSTFANNGIIDPYNVELLDQDAPFYIGYGDSGPMPSPPAKPVQPTPQPSGPSYVTCNIIFHTDGQYNSEFDNVQFTPDPYRGNSYTVTEAEVLYYINSTNKHYKNGTWPSGNDSSCYYYVKDSHNRNFYIYNPNWNTGGHGTMGAASVDDLGDKHITLVDGGTYTFTMTYNWDHSWDSVMPSASSLSQ